MKKYIIPMLVITLMITTTALPALAGSMQYGGFGQKEFGQKEYSVSGASDVTLDVCITTDYVNGFEDHGLLIREYDIGANVWMYTQFSHEVNLYGTYMSTDWYYDNGTGMEYKFSWWWTVDGNWTDAYMWAWEPMSDYYGPGYGVIKVTADGEYIGQSNYYALGNTQPNKPSISGETNGTTGDEYEYTFNAIDPDGFNISYFVDWGDGTDSGWTDFTESGTDVKLSHTWDTNDDYIIKCKVRDLVHNESDWEELEISMPKNKPFNFNLLSWLFERFPNAFPILRHMLGM